MIKINLERDSLFEALGLKRMRDSYMLDTETSPQERFAYVAEAFSSNPEHAQRLYEYASNHWLSFATPILSYGRTKNGLPISCYLAYLEDSSEGLVDTLSEVNWLSMSGGGVGVHLGIRSADTKSVGVMPHMKVYEASAHAFCQGTTRRGSYAMYLDIDHPDIVQFLEMRKPTGDHNLRTAHLNHGIVISDKFMQLIERCMIEEGVDDTWELIQPNTGQVVDTISAKDLWARIIETRVSTGEPYLWFNDTANKYLPVFQKALGLKIHGSNLCSEISLATSTERTAVCCLSSPNLEYYDCYKNNYLFFRDVLEMLDNVLEVFIKTAPAVLHKAVYSATRERSVGIGALGLAAYFQSKNIAFESASAKSLNFQIFKNIRSQLDRANEELANERGACPDAKEGGVNKRCSHVMAIAPNASSSIIMGNTSPSIEPYVANVFRQDTTSGSYTTRNKYLEKVILEHAFVQSDPNWVDEVWASIIANDGSVQHLEWLSEAQKYVFKTGREIDQRWLVDLAADRQQFIDQAQSVNLYFNANVSIPMLHAVHFMAWKQGLKGLYYCRSTQLRSAERVGQQVERIRIEEELSMSELAAGTTCLACEG